MENLANMPHLLELNRVQRLYIGGKLLDEWQGAGNCIDGTMSEEFIASTVAYIGPQKDIPDRGISRTLLEDGRCINLRDLINLDRGAFLGDLYKDHCADGQMGVMARVGDAAVRLVLQVHPSSADAQKYFGCNSGKTEAWYIINSREIDGVHPYIYAGFKKHVTKELWRDLFNKQDIPGMLDCMHRIEVDKGDTILIPSGMAHAMGAGNLFLEIHEACDYTIRLERNYAVAKLSDDEMHYGVGYDAMFEMLSYNTYTDEEIRKRILFKPVPELTTDGGVLSSIIDFAATSRFRVKHLILNGCFELPDMDSHYIIITTKGSTTFCFEDKKMVAPQGRGVFVPAACKALKLEGEGEVVIGYPFKLGPTVRFSPSLACASQLNMLPDVQELDKVGIDMLHIDVMDGNYVPNLSLNLDLCHELKKMFIHMELDVHLMVNKPMDYIDRLAALGADWVTFHTDATPFARRMLDRIKSLGMKAGVALNPSQSVDSLMPIIDEVDMVLLMSIEPGFSGQTFMPISLKRIQELNTIRKEKDLKFLINVDGGLDSQNGKACVEKGADILVLGLFACFIKGKSISEAYKTFDEELKR